MARQAVNQRWPIPPEKRELIVLSLLHIIASKDSSERAKTSAARALIQMEQQNQTDEHRFDPSRQLNVNITPEQLTNMSDDELEALERRLLGREG